MSRRVIAMLNEQEREILTSSPDQQETAHASGAYDYLLSTAMTPRLGIIAGYVRTLGVVDLLDVGCGNGALCGYLPLEAKYTGIDISSTAIHRAKERFSAVPTARFVAADFRVWQPDRAFDAVVWAGLGLGCGRVGRPNFSDWEDIMKRMLSAVSSNGIIVLEFIAPYLAHMPKSVSRLAFLMGCDFDCLGSKIHARRCVRVFRRLSIRGK